MNNRLARHTAALLSLTLFACGASSHEVRLRGVNDELNKELAEQKQHNLDLKQRVQIVDARNRVLTDLVTGLTSAERRNAGDASAADSAHASLQALDKDLEGLIASVQHSREDLDAERAQRAALAQELARAKQAMETTRTQQAHVSARAHTLRDLLVQLSPLIESAALDIRLWRNRFVLQLPEDTLFESDDANITKPGKAVLNQVANVLKSASNREFQIGGHTDSQPARSGRYRNNWQLSSIRALNVMLYLVDRGVPKPRLSAAAYADTQPVADETSAEGRKANRRIEIVLLPNLEELPDLSALSDLLSKPKDATDDGTGTAAPSTASPPAGPAQSPVPSAQPSAASETNDSPVVR
jgi:chemotaxis protein MotB